jgi:hypothetical protein
MAREKKEFCSQKFECKGLNLDVLEVDKEQTQNKVTLLKI